ncbi:MAG: thiamine phosphate synthase [Oscillospiraceae bacterium]|jgi:thiamine-phosphate diphosphorylase|nr:thiamine phosphate synthase [Oscillospiraceae bacterium]MDD3261994.1 thiamine phosphate synthase [Oscillospiraceae bacterium]
MSDILCVTSRHLCRGDFLQRMAEIAAAHPAGILLREKDLSPQAYEKLAKEVFSICRRYETPLILHSYAACAQKLGCDSLHLPLPVLRHLPQQQRCQFRVLGASCHSGADVLEAAALGCTYVTLGHIFATDCKKGLPPRGTAFLREVCTEPPLPVWAIGGIGPQNVGQVRAAGAAGACVMSGFMQCDSPTAFLREMERKK